MRPITELADPAELRRVYGCFPSGVAAICAVGDDGVPDGMAVSSFTSVSLDPPLVSVCMQNTSTTWPRLRGAARLGVSVLAEGQDAVARSLAARGGDRFAGVEWSVTEGGAVLVGGAAAWLDCEVEGEYAAGDHTVVLLRVRSLSGDPERAPLVFHGSRFRALTAPVG
ncbi:flavin reductase family protein [Streptomyces sp. NPDC002623]